MQEMGMKIYMVDRSLALIRPKAPFLAWLNSLPGQPLGLTLDTLRSDCTSFLLAKYDTPEEAIAYIDDIYKQIFSLELLSWCEDRNDWPKDMGLKAFWEWFDVEIHEMVLDTLEEVLNNSIVDSGLLN